MFGPIIVVGPRVTEVGSFTGDIIVPVDGSDFSETILPMAAAWGIALGATPWIVEVLNQPIAVSADVFESSYPHRLANEMQRAIAPRRGVRGAPRSVRRRGHLRLRRDA